MEKKKLRKYEVVCVASDMKGMTVVPIEASEYRINKRGLFFFVDEGEEIGQVNVATFAKEAWIRVKEIRE
jgi:acetylornithine deacetylase/succinyl-diaminopimelate desuccinylase-like protein